MPVRQTIALLGATGKSDLDLAIRIASGNYRLLLITKDIEKLEAASAYQKSTLEQSGIELMDGEKDGCWEADIIFLSGASSKDKALIEKVREVATRKIVACFSVTEELGKLLPYSRIVEIHRNRRSREPLITGEDPEAIGVISDILKRVNEH